MERRRSEGFTLIELAIVLVIIGLLLGAVMKGKELIQAAKVKRVMKQAHAAISSAETYYDYTGKWPGAHSGSAGTDICALNVIRLIKDDGSTKCAPTAQRAFEFYGAKISNADGSKVYDQNGTDTPVEVGIWLDGMGRTLTGEAANALYTMFLAYTDDKTKKFNGGVVCFAQDDQNAAATTTAAQRKAMISIARMYAGDAQPILNTDCVKNRASEACLVNFSGEDGTKDGIYEDEWEISAEGLENMELLDSLATTRMQACIRLTVD
ncbi:MAG: type II secretion system protein [Aquificae bacterium]|nr:type II secretion system protein [Aquificota bacterium]